MWNKACLCKVLVLAVFAMSILGFKINKPLSREQIYLEVLKNITQVHNILSELLVNYKHLKEVYEAQAKPHNELSAEMQFDDEDGQKKNKTDFDKDPDFHPVTQMILFDEGLLDENSDKSNESIDVKENLSPDFIDNTKMTVDKEKEFVGKPVYPNKNNMDLSKTDSLLQNKGPYAEPPLNLSDKPELIIVGTALKYSKNKPNKKNKKNKQIETELAPNIEDYDLNKSILIEGHNDHRKNDPFKSNIYNSDSEKREEEILTREHVEHKILREAYGSACLKVAIRKCYKTLKQVKKLICTMGFRCKDKFKDSFKSFSKTGCTNEFSYKENTGKKAISEKCRTPQKASSNCLPKIVDKARTPEDSTRTGSDVNYYELCLPVMMSDETRTDNTTIPSRDLSKTQPINVLRDRYEMECQRLSTQKCERACNFAVANACEQSPCERKEQKYFFRTCRKECKEAFGGRDADSDEYSDSDDNDSDDSDDNDDSDDSDRDSMTFE